MTCAAIYVRVSTSRQADHDLSMPDQIAQCRAYCERKGIAYQVMDVLKAMEADAGIRLKELRVDGGACSNNLLMQFQSDLLSVPVVRPKVAETTALGAAYLAGLGVGFWESETDIATQWQVDRKFKPAMKPALRKQLCAGWTKALSRAKAWEK